MITTRNDMHQALAQAARDVANAQAEAAETGYGGADLYEARRHASNAAYELGDVLGYLAQYVPADDDITDGAYCAHSVPDCTCGLDGAHR